MTEVPRGEARPSDDLPTSWPWSYVATRRLLSRHLVGAGLDVGPGSQPFPIVNPGVDVRYVDRHEPNENAELFPELDGPEFHPPDIVSDLDVDGLDAVHEASVDFVVASHVLEHVANPLRLVDGAHRALRDGGVLLLLLPEPSRTFDRGRPITPVADVVAEFERGATAVPDAKIVAFIEETGGRLPDDAAELAGLIELHRRRSVHVHVWDPDAFFEVILHGVRELGHRWELVDAVIADEEGPDGMDFGWVLRKSGRGVEPEAVAEQLTRSWELWRAHRGAICAAHDEWQAAATARDAEVATLSGRCEALQQELDDTRRELEALHQTKTMRLLARPRQGYGWARRTVLRKV